MCGKCKLINQSVSFPSPHSCLELMLSVVCVEEVALYGQHDGQQRLVYICSSKSGILIPDFYEDKDIVPRFLTF